MTPTTTKTPTRHDDPNAAIATAVTLLLADRDVTVEQLAVYAGLNRSSLYKKLKGEFGWKATDIAALATYFRVQPGDLFTGADVLTSAHMDPYLPAQQHTHRYVAADYTLAA